MWSLAYSTQWPRDVKHYQKKHARELAAVLHNLKERYLAMLNVCSNSKAVQAGFLHHEPDGIVAIDQKGGGTGLQETRLYTFADDKTNTLWLITIGNKDDQPDDIQFSRKFVESLKADSQDETK